MSITKHTGPRGIRYEVRYRGSNGNERSKRFRTRRDAEDYERDQRVAMRRGVWSDPKAGRVTLAEWVGEWQATIVHLSASSKRIHADNVRNHVLPDVVGRNTRGQLVVLAEGLGSFELGKLTTAQLTRWVSSMLRKPRRGSATMTLAPATVHQAYRTLHLTLEAAVTSGRLGRNPLDGVKPPRVAQVPMRFLDEREVAKLAAAIDPRYRALVLVGCLCGLRAGELLALRWENVDMLGRSIKVVEQTDRENGHGMVKQPKTAAGRRAVSMPRAVVDALAEHALSGAGGASVAGERLSDGYGSARLHVVGSDERTVGAGSGPTRVTGLVFTAPRGGMVDLNHLRRLVWVPAVQAAGLEPLRIHDMRHTAASLAIKAGADVKVVQRMLGHASAAMTLDRYGHLMPGQAEAVADRIDALMSACGA